MGKKFVSWMQLPDNDGKRPIQCAHPRCERPATRARTEIDLDKRGGTCMPLCDEHDDDGRT